MAYNSDTECIICFEECSSDDNYMKNRIVNDDASGNVNTAICNCSYNLHQSCYLEYIKKFGMTCMVCKKEYVSYKYVLQQNMNNVYVDGGTGGVGGVGTGGVGVGVGGVGTGHIDVTLNTHGTDDDIGIRVYSSIVSGSEQIVNNLGYSRYHCQCIICFFIFFFICIFLCICVYMLHLLIFL